MADNGRKEFSECGVEFDYTSKARKYHTSKHGKAKEVKKKMNKRFRTRGKMEIKEKQSKGHNG